jgi:hypothetical protein
MPQRLRPPPSLPRLSVVIPSRSQPLKPPALYQGCRGCKAIRAALTKFMGRRRP